MPNNPLKNTNAYLIKSDDRNLLIDTGFRRDECRKALLEGLSELDVSMDKTDIFITHMHPDHCGLAPELAGQGTKIFMSSEDARRLVFSHQPGIETRTYDTWRGNGFNDEQIENSPMFPKNRSDHPTFEDYVHVEDGHTFNYGGHELRAIMTPGHSPGHMCLYDAENKIMFLGDHVLFDVTPNITTWMNFPDSLGSYIKSLVSIREYDVDVALPAHRGVRGTMPERIDEIIEHHGRRVKELADALDMYPGSTAYQLAAFMSWNIRFNGNWEDFPLSQKFFAVGETRSHLDYLLARERAAKQRVGNADYYYPA